jgi:hypothetical protein
MMQDPVSTIDGHTYERRSIEQWFAAGHITSPKTGVLLPSTTLIPAHALRDAIEEYEEPPPRGGGRGRGREPRTVPVSTLQVPLLPEPEPKPAVPPVECCGSKCDADSGRHDRSFIPIARFFNWVEEAYQSPRHWVCCEPVVLCWHRCWKAALSPLPDRCQQACCCCSKAWATLLHGFFMRFIYFFECCCVVAFGLPLFAFWFCVVSPVLVVMGLVWDCGRACMYWAEASWVAAAPAAAFQAV